MVFLATVLLSLALFVCRREVAERIVVSALSLWLAYESVLGIMQLLGIIVSHNSMCPMTGDFANSGPYGGFLAVCIAVVFAAAWRWRDSVNLYDRILFWLSSVSGCLGIVVLPASMSRTGFVALLVSAVAFALIDTESKSYFKSHKWLILSVVAVAFVVGAGAFCLKKDSALGRFHIWEMELRAIADKPLTGHGFGKALGAYGDAQAEYFETEERGQERVRIAGCPEYAFNEYLRMGMEFGILGLLLSVAVIVLGTTMLCRSDSSLTFGLVAWGTFAMASYPLDVWQLRLLLAVFLGAAIGVSVKVGKRGRLILVPALVCLSVGSMLVWLPENKHRKEAESKWLEERRFADFEIFDGMADRLTKLYPRLRMKFRYLYDYGYALHKEGRYSESNVILMKGASISSDPMFYNIIGKNFEALGDYDEAERNYIHSHNMVPSRLYPYILLMEMEEKRGDTKQALSYAQKALSLPVNDRNMSMRDLHNRAKKFYDEHSEDY